MKNLCCVSRLVFVLWVAFALGIFAIKTHVASVSIVSPFSYSIPSGVASIASTLTVPKFNANDDVKPRNPNGPGFLYLFWSPSRHVQDIVDTASDFTADVMFTLLGLLPWFTVLMLQEGLEGVHRLTCIMIGHVVSSLCNYIFLCKYGIALKSWGIELLPDPKGRYYEIVGWHISITSFLCCINFLVLLVFSLAKYRRLFAASFWSMLRLTSMAIVPPILSAVICYILHRFAKSQIQIKVLGSMATVCTILMHLTRFFALVGCTWWALTVAAVGVVSGLLWMVHFNHDCSLPYKVVSSVGSVGRMFELFFLLRNKLCPPATDDLEPNGHREGLI